MPYFAYIEAYETGAYSRISVSWEQRGISAKTKSRARVSGTGSCMYNIIFNFFLSLSCILYVSIYKLKKIMENITIFFIKDLHILVPPSAASFFLSWTNRSSLVAILRTIEDKWLPVVTCTCIHIVHTDETRMDSNHLHHVKVSKLKIFQA